MSNSIWKTPDIKPEENKKIIFYAGGGHYAYMGFYCKKVDMFGAWLASQTQKWTYYDDLIAQADKAERLEKENEAMREEFEVWHGNYKCVVEDKERLERAVQYLKRLHIATIEEYNPKEKELAEQTIDYAVKVAIEQESNN